MPKFSLATMPDLTGKVALVTGGTSGLGQISARNMAMKGAIVFFTARSQGKAEQAIREAEEHYQGLLKASRIKGQGITLKEADSISDHLIPLICDLGDLQSVKAAVDTFLSHPRAQFPSHQGAEGQSGSGTSARLDILMNNAAVCAVEYGLTKDGLEMQNGTNTVAHYFLTLLLLPTLVKTSQQPEYHAGSGGDAPSTTVRIVFLSSLGHKLTPTSRGPAIAAQPPHLPASPPPSLRPGETLTYRTLDGINDSFADVKFAAFRRYAMSKAGTILLTRTLASRLRSSCSSSASASASRPPAISVVCADPGQSKTNLVQGPIASYGLLFKLYHWLSTPTYLSPAQAVETQLYAAASPGVDARALSGRYLSGAGKLVLEDGESASTPTLKPLLGGLGVGGHASALASDRDTQLGAGAHGKALLAFCDEFFKDKLGVDAKEILEEAGLTYDGPLQ